MQVLGRGASCKLGQSASLRAMPIAHLALPSPLRHGFDYRLPAGVHELPPGVRVRAPFGRREVIGWLLHEAAESDVPAAKMRAVLEIIDSEPALNAELWQLALWAARYYQHPIGDALTQMVPALIRQGEPLRATLESCWRLTARGLALSEDGLSRAPKQLAALQLLSAHPQGLSETTCRALQIAREALKALSEKGLAECFQPEHAAKAPTPAWPALGLAQAELRLNAEQAVAFDALRKAEDGFRVWLLQGVTGSGKTEVYLQHIAQVLRSGRQVLVLVPEIGLTPQTVARFQARFRCPVLALHSGLSDRERMQVWRQAREGLAGIIIGTRSAVFTPLARPGLIVIDEEHDLSFKQQEGFRYHGRDVAIRRAQLENIPIVLGSATPSLETLANVHAGRYQRLELKLRAGGAKAPLVRCVDLRGQILTDGLCTAAREAMTETLARGEQVLVFLNRRGFAPVMLCHACGWQAGCDRCDAKPTLHRAPMRLQCHHCGSERPPPMHCPDCGSSDLRPAGVGTERLADALSQHFANTPVYRVDRDSTRRKGSFDVLMNAIAKPEAAVLVGTQMLAKGHHFPNVTLVVIPNCDGGLFSADFRGPERLAQQLVQVSGRAGRAEKPGRVLIQTHQPDHPLLQQLFSQGYDACAQTLLNERQLMGLPPAASMALLRAEAPQDSAPQELLSDVAHWLREDEPLVQAWGPMPAPMARKAGMHRWHLLLKTTERKPLHLALSRVVAWLEASPEARRVRWSIDIDPQELS
ncbi:primosomal protein N' [Paraperlucidibaca wandonensis]|uniref:Replication restart protein PriA n=1 Tax=Paraperlucidibaca wandonensis TaxID=1268273 RepID=A0ABW3HFP8_9GAMM